MNRTEKKHIEFNNPAIVFKIHGESGMLMAKRNCNTEQLFPLSSSDLQIYFFNISPKILSEKCIWS